MRLGQVWENRVKTLQAKTKECWNMHEAVSLSFLCRMFKVSLSCHELTRTHSHGKRIRKTYIYISYMYTFISMEYYNPTMVIQWKMVILQLTNIAIMLRPEGWVFIVIPWCKPRTAPQVTETLTLAKRSNCSVTWQWWWSWCGGAEVGKICQEKKRVVYGSLG
jgi:hypothetical protein